MLLKPPPPSSLLRMNSLSLLIFLIHNPPCTRARTPALPPIAVENRAVLRSLPPPPHTESAPPACSRATLLHLRGALYWITPIRRQTKSPPLPPHSPPSHTDPLADPRSGQARSCLRLFVLALPSPENMLFPRLQSPFPEVFPVHSIKSSAALSHLFILSCLLFPLSRKPLHCWRCKCLECGGLLTT